MTLVNTQQVEIIDKKIFTTVMLNKNVKTFVIHIVYLNFKIKIIIYLAQKAQITLLSIKEISKIILAKYLDFANIISKELDVELFERFSIFKHTINLGKDKQLSRWRIYGLEWIELVTFKTYIKINLANSFI